MTSLREIGEREVLRRLRAARPAAGVRVDSGDDAAVLEPSTGHDLVATCDAFVEGRHFDPAWLKAAEIGARLATANLSDLAAMAASPRWALLSAGVRPDHAVEALLALQSGASETLESEGAGIVGGNLAAVEGAEWFSVTLLGEAPKGAAWTRAGARAGDWVAVTGSPGRAGAGYRLARALKGDARAGRWKPLLDAWLHPGSRVAFAWSARASRAVSAAIDLSDGFAGDLSQLCEASGVGAELGPGSWPNDPALEAAAGVLELAALDLRLGPSDDYELILAVDPARRGDLEAVASAEGVPIAFPGRFVEGSGIRLVQADGTRRALRGEGFDHFGTK